MEGFAPEVTVCRVMLQSVAPAADCEPRKTVREPRVLTEDELASELASLTGVALLLCGNRVLAEDLAAEAVERVLRRSRRSEIESLQPYLRRTLVNLVKRRHRRSVAEAAAESRSWTRPEYAEPGDQVVIEDEVDRALGALPFHQKAVVVLRFFADMTAPEIARVLRVPVGTVESRTSRALATMRTLLGSEEGGS